MYLLTCVSCLFLIHLGVLYIPEIDTLLKDKRGKRGKNGKCIGTCGSRGGRGGHDPPVPLKSSYKKKAATGGPLYLMFLGTPPPLTILDPILIGCALLPTIFFEWHEHSSFTYPVSALIYFGASWGWGVVIVGTGVALADRVPHICLVKCGKVNSWMLERTHPHCIACLHWKGTTELICKWFTSSTHYFALHILCKRDSPPTIVILHDHGRAMICAGGLVGLLHCFVINCWK